MIYQTLFHMLPPSLCSFNGRPKGYAQKNRDRGLTILKFHFHRILKILITMQLLNSFLIYRIDINSFAGFMTSLGELVTMILTVLQYTGELFECQIVVLIHLNLYGFYDLQRLSILVRSKACTQIKLSPPPLHL